MGRFDDDDGVLDRPRTRAGLDPLQAIELLGRRLGGAIVVGSALIALALYAGGDEEGPRYQMIAADGEVLRLNTESGTIIACNATRCTRILQRGQDLAEDQGNSLFTIRVRSDAGAPEPAAPAAPAAQPQLPPPQQR